MILQDLSFIIGSNAIKYIYYLCLILLVFANIFIPPIAYHCATFCNQPKAVSIYAGSHFYVSQPLLIISTNVTSNDTRNILIRQYIRNVIPVNDNE